MNFKKLAMLSALVLGLMDLVSQGAQAATLTVGNATSGPCPHTFTSIQSAVNVASAGDTIQVCPGTYDEQVTVTTSNLTIKGAGAGSTTVRPFSVSANSSSLFSGAFIAAIVVVDGATGVTVEALTIDGSTGAPNGCSPTYVGIFYRAASGAISDTH